MTNGNSTSTFYVKTKIDKSYSTQLYEFLKKGLKYFGCIYKTAHDQVLLNYIKLNLKIPPPPPNGHSFSHHKILFNQSI